MARYLISLSPERWRSAARRGAFLCGNLLPDFNPLTYLRGIRQSRRMAGHDFPYSQRHIRRVALRLQKTGVKDLADCYVLGTLIHYLADSFTYPHTADFRESMREHNRYERELHAVFSECVSAARANRPPPPPQNLSDFLSEARIRYEAAPQGLLRDGREILFVCTSIYGAILQEKA